jgi:hypothetical protein
LTCPKEKKGGKVSFLFLLYDRLDRHIHHQEPNIQFEMSTAKHVAFTRNWDASSSSKLRSSYNDSLSLFSSDASNHYSDGSSNNNDDSANVSSGGSPNSLTSTMRQLQHKCRNIELGRADALRERDELQRLLNENQRRESLLRSRTAGHSAEVLMDIESKIAKFEDMKVTLKSTLTDLEAGCNTTQDVVHSRRKDLEGQEAHLGVLRSQLLALQNRKKDYDNEITVVRERAAALELRQQRTRIAAVEEEARVKALIASAELEFIRARQERVHAKARADALQTYLQLLLRVNKDLCDAVYARELAEKQMKKFVIIPRYSWPKGVVDKAKAVLTDAAAEHALQIKKREEIKHAQKTFKDTLKRASRTAKDTEKRTAKTQAPSAWVARPTKPCPNVQAPPTRMASRTEKNKRLLKHFTAVQHDVNLRALQSSKTAAVAHTVAGYLRPKSY